MSVTQPQPKFWSGNEIRETFLRFFEGKGHRRVRSSSLVPHGDPTLLFTNAGMNQFKDVFLGLEKRDYDKATTAQKCVRAGGKHNDLENVGFTKRHHTFFEMLGNFSFGDYFKEKAIPYAWELITSPEWFAIPKDKLYVTIFGGAEVAPGSPAGAGTTLGVDEEASKFWLAENVPADRIVPIPGLKENFWAMGDTGPCGPCSEIHYDMGPEASEQGHTDCTPLPRPSIDTGMGLERVAAVLQGVISNYDTDLFQPLMKRAAELCGVDLQREERLEEGRGGAASLRVIADHARAATFLVSDGVTPSNDGRGYVLRKIIRRAVRHADSLFAERPVPIMQAMAHEVTRQMQTAYPELAANVELVGRTLGMEEDRFVRTIGKGLTHLYTDIATEYENALQKFDQFQEGRTQLRAELLTLRGVDSTRRVQAIFDGLTDPGKGTVVLPGEKAFRLYDTFGLPLDFIMDAARDLGVQVDEAGFDQAMQEQRTRARASWKGGGAKEAANPAYAKIAENHKTEPDFYFATNSKDARIGAIVTKNGSVAELKAGESGEVVLDRTVIYAESGGQVADAGAFYDPSGSQVVAEVSGAYYPVARLVAHRVTAKDTLRVGDRISVQADAERRARIMRNHSGTHLVHAALRNILGTHVKQAGSLNAPDRLRFDFSHFAHVDAEELRDIEQQVNDEIRYNCQIETTSTARSSAAAHTSIASAISAC